VDKRIKIVTQVEAYGMYKRIEVDERLFATVSVEMEWNPEETMRAATVNWSAVGSVSAADSTVYAEALQIAAKWSVWFDEHQSWGKRRVLHRRAYLEAKRAEREARNA